MNGMQKLRFLWYIFVSCLFTSENPSMLDVCTCILLVYHKKLPLAISVISISIRHNTINYIYQFHRPGLYTQNHWRQITNTIY